MSNTRITDEWGSFSAIPNEFIDAAGDLSDQSRWLFVLLRRYTNGQTGKAFPSYKAIQERTGWTPKTIAKAVRELEEAGWIEREKALGDVTQYILKRKSHFPQGSGVLPTGKRSTSRGEVGVLPTGKSNKTDVNRLTKQTDRERGQIAVIPADAKPARPLPFSGGSAVDIAVEHFPQMGIWQQELVDNAGIQHLTIWRKCCEDWRDNRYSPRNVKGLIDSYYKAETQHSKEQINNGKNGTGHKRESHNERAARETFELIRQLTGAESGSDSTDPADTIFKLPPAFGGR